MTSRKVTATEWIVNENKLSQNPLVAWHVLSSICVHFGTWGLIFLAKNQFSHIFPASAWSPFLAVNLTAKQARLLCRSKGVEVEKKPIQSFDIEAIFQLADIEAIYLSRRLFLIYITGKTLLCLFSPRLCQSHIC